MNSVESSGKVNLTLELLGTRSDGYHELRSVVLPVSLRETVEVEPSADGALSVETVFEGVDAADVATLDPSKNLAVRAADALRRAVGDLSLGAAIRVVKRLPIGAGMAGGSADAAGALLALQPLWAPDMPREKLLAVGASVGSDVPALMLGGPALMEGRGERVSPLAPPPSPVSIVVAFPGTHISTKSVYSAWDAAAISDSGEATDAAAAALAAGDVRTLAASLVNGLQRVVDELHPETREAREALLRAGALGAMLSGSGSAVFGLAEDEAHAHRILAALPSGLEARALTGGAAS